MTRISTEQPEVFDQTEKVPIYVCFFKNYDVINVIDLRSAGNDVMVFSCHVVECTTSFFFIVFKILSIAPN
jgi:hypothetical protein